MLLHSPSQCRLSACAQLSACPRMRRQQGCWSAVLSRRRARSVALRLPLFFFFFSSRRRHTRSDRDWSSDVCSSDLFRAADVTPQVTWGTNPGQVASVTDRVPDPDQFDSDTDRKSTAQALEYMGLTDRKSVV